MKSFPANPEVSARTKRFVQRQRRRDVVLLTCFTVYCLLIAGVVYLAAIGFIALFDWATR